MRKKYTMILDTPGPRGGGLFSPQTYTLNEEFGEKLVREGRAVPYKPKKYVKIIGADGKEITITWGEYLKKKK